MIQMPEKVHCLRPLLESALRRRVINQLVQHKPNARPVELEAVAGLLASLDQWRTQAKAYGNECDSLARQRNDLIERVGNLTEEVRHLATVLRRERIHAG